MDIAGVFDDWATRGRAEGMEAGHLATARPALEALRLGPGRRLLDLGTGNGWAVRHALATGAQAVGIDLSRGMLRRATHLGAPCAQADAQRLPFRDGTFDVVWSMEAIYYAPDPDAVLREAHRVLRPGGPLHVLLDHYEENTASHGWPDELRLPMARRSEDAWRDAVAAAGFTEARAQRLRAENGEAWKREHGTLWLQGVARAGHRAGRGEERKAPSSGFEPESTT